MPVGVDVSAIRSLPDERTSDPSGPLVPLIERLGADAVPVLPKALAYPEVVPAEYHQHVLFEPGNLTSALRLAISDVAGLRVRTDGLAGSEPGELLG